MDLIKHVDDGGAKLKKSGLAIYMSIGMRIIRAGKGDRRSSHVQHAGEPCWVDAYPLVDNNRYVRSQMSQLDRHREARFHAFRT